MYLQLVLMLRAYVEKTLYQWHNNFFCSTANQVTKKYLMH